MKTEILEKNMNSLCKRYPDWKVDDYDRDTVEKHIQIEQEDTYDGKPISTITIADKKYYLAGKYNPDLMANIQAHILKEQNVHFQFFIGMGDGRVLREYLLMMEEDDYCLVYEPSIQMFTHVIKYYDFSDLFSNEHCIWLVEGVCSYSIEMVLANIMTLENVMNFDIHITNQYDRFLSKHVKETIKKIKSSVETMQYNWGTNIFFQECVAENVLLNLRYLSKIHSAKGLAHILSEKEPVIVVAAGPSLDKNIEKLKKVKKKACIIACDTALKPLLERNIVPDFFVVIDPKKPMELFENKEVWKIPMIADIFIPYQIMNRHKGIKFLFDNAKISKSFIDKVVEKDKEISYVSTLMTGGSVANSAFAVAEMMGAKTIILVGQDLANTGGKGHATGTFQKDSVNTSGGELLVESVDGGMVSTSAQFRHYLEWFEQEINKNEDIHVIDATEGGALIHGSEVMSLEDAIRQYCIVNCKMTEKIEEISYHFSDTQQEELRKIYISMPQELQKLRKMAKKGKVNYENLEKMVDKNALSKELKKTLRKISSTNKKLEEHFLWPIANLANANEHFTILVRTTKEEKEGSDTIKEDIALGKRYMEKILANIDHIAPFVDELAEYYSKD